MEQYCIPSVTHTPTFSQLSPAQRCVLQLKVLTRRQQLSLRATKKEQKGKGKGRGKGGKNTGKGGRGKGGRGKGGRKGTGGNKSKTADNAKGCRAKKVVEDEHGGSTESANKRSRKNASIKASEPGDADSSSKRRKKATSTVPDQTKTTTSKRSSGSDADPTPAKRSRKKTAPQECPVTSAGPGDAAGEKLAEQDQVEPQHGAKHPKTTAAKSRPARKVATPQAGLMSIPEQTATVITELVPVLKAESTRQWKSGKTDLKHCDFEPDNFSRCALNKYFTRARPAIGLRTRGHVDSPYRKSPKNTEWANFSFKMADVCNVGLAFKCATLTVTLQI